MIRRLRSIGLGLMLFAGHAAAQAAPKEPATISSDDLDIRNHGARTIFTGHVVLKQAPYRITCERMVQIQSTGIATATKKVHGYWISENGERAEGTGDRAVYDPRAQTMTLIGHAVLTRWTTDPKAPPEVLTADRVYAFRAEKQVVAVTNVVMTQGPDVTKAPEARYDESTGILNLEGGRVHVHVEGDKGKADFEGDRGWVSTDPKHAQLIDHVKGHIIPAP